MTKRFWWTLLSGAAAASLCVGAFAQGAAAKTWGAELNPGGKVPVGSFQAFYINTNEPRTVIATEAVREVAINYPWSDFHGIKSEDFAGYWAGHFDFKRDEERLIEISQSWSKTRVVIDGAVVYEGGSDISKPYTFSKGRHLVEVEYINNWHTTSMRANFNNAATPPLNYEQVREQLQGRDLRGAVTHYVGLYESSARDLTVEVDVAPADKPVILVLSSYDSIDWVISEAKRGTVRAIVHGSRKPGTQVRGLDGRGVRVLKVSGTLGPYALDPSCRCTAGEYRCERSADVLRLGELVDHLTGAPLASLSAIYNAKQVSIPGMAYDEAAKGRARTADAEQSAAQARCAKKANPDFDSMFDK